jgi:hypothetical protein
MATMLICILHKITLTKVAYFSKQLPLKILISYINWYLYCCFGSLHYPHISNNDDRKLQKYKDRQRSIFWDITPCNPLFCLFFNPEDGGEMSVDFQRTTWHYVSEHRTLHNHHCENLKSYKDTKVWYCECEAIPVTGLGGP